MQISVLIKRHSVLFKTMGDHGFFLYLARLDARACAISRQGIERLISSIYYNFLLSPMKVAGDQAHRNQGKSTAWSLAYMPTLLDYPAVSQIWHWSLAILYGSPNLPDKMDVWAFLCFSLKFSPFFSQKANFFIHCTVSGTFFVILSYRQRLCRHYNDKSEFW